jgi:hypothetical protein
MPAAGAAGCRPLAQPDAGRWRRHARARGSAQEHAVADPYRDENLGNWAGDFAASDRLGLFPDGLREVAQGVLETLLRAACAERNCEPAALLPDDLKAGLLGAVARLELPEAVRAFVPSLCRAYLEDLQTRGRLGSGQALGRYVGALKEAFLAATPGIVQTYARPGAKIGRNEPCPCGSGRKYKKCCGSDP